LGITLAEVEQLPIIEYSSWVGIPTTNEILDAHLSTMICILNNANSKKKIKVKDVMLTIPKVSKEEELASNLKEELKARFQVKKKG